MRAALLCAALLAGVQAYAADAPPVSVQAHVEPEQPTIGQRFRYVLEVSAPAAADVAVTQPGEHLGDFDVVDFGADPPAERDGRTVTPHWWRLVGWSPGDHTIESPPVHVRQPGGDSIVCSPGLQPTRRHQWGVTVRPSRSTGGSAPKSTTSKSPRCSPGCVTATSAPAGADTSST